jgi:hypothetical protein
VRKEVERNFNRREKIKKQKRKKRQKKKKMADEALLENVWLKTIDNIDHESFVPKANKAIYTKPRRRYGNEKNGLTTTEIDCKDRKIQSSSLHNNRMTKTQNKSSAMKSHFQIIENTVNVSNSIFDKKVVSLIGFGRTRLSRTTDHPIQCDIVNDQVKPSHPTRFSFYDPNDTKTLQLPPTRTVQMSIDSFETESEVSGITTPTVFTRLLSGPPVLSRVSKEKIRDIDGEIPVEEAWRDPNVKKERIRLDNQKRNECHIAKNIFSHTIQHNYKNDKATRLDISANQIEKNNPYDQAYHSDMNEAIKHIFSQKYH